VRLLAGKAVAAWNSSFSGKGLDATLDLFGQEAEPYISAIHVRFEEVVMVLARATCFVTLTNPAEPSLA